MTKEEWKAAQEREVFREFARAANRVVAVNGVESRPPPEPDILCHFADGSRAAFEIVRLVDRDLANMTSKAVDNPSHSIAVWFADPTLEIIRTKLEQKNYSTAYPMELLAWGDDTLDPKDVWLPKFAETLKTIFDASSTGFQHLWVVNLGRLASSDRIWLDHGRL